MHALILAGGLGTRLRAVVPDLPKPMAPVGKRPFLAYLLDYLTQQGVTQVVLSVGYRHETIHEYFGDRCGSLPLRYSIESAPLGTGGAIKKALPLMGDEPFFIVNGDTFVVLDYEAMWQRHLSERAPLTIALTAVADTARYGRVDVVDGVITQFREKGVSGAGLINSGVYLVEPRVLEHAGQSERFSFESDYLYPQVQMLRPLGFETEGYFIDIGVPEDYQRAQSELGKFARS